MQPHFWLLCRESTLTGAEEIVVPFLCVVMKRTFLRMVDTILPLANRLCPLFVAIFIFLRQNPAFCNKFCRNFLLLLEIREETQYSSFELLMDPEAKSTYLHGDNRLSSCYTGIPICPIHVLQLSELVSDTVDVLLPLHPLFSCPLPLPINKLRRCF